MNKKKINLIIHPVRLRILQVLSNSRLTTSDIADALPSFPKSSIYRHLKILLDEGMVEIAETRPIKGTLEKVYQLALAPKLEVSDLQGISREELLRQFTTFTASLLHGFSTFLDSTADEKVLHQIFGYTDFTFYATDEEMEDFRKILLENLARLTQYPPSPERTQRLLSITTFPLIRKENE